ncbi:MAG TPA: acyl-CoA dehydrogenase family protein [Thermoleophilaceae bacterium]|nr:acyl-CoA dehydrogenase family protein [Thermoleophilaceae bacterium]
MSVADRSMGLGLRGLRALAGLEVIDRAGLRKPVERLIYEGSKNGFSAATAAGRTFTAATKLGKPARQAKPSAPKLFDLEPDDEQKMLQEAFGDFGSEKLRPIAQDADSACKAPDDVLAQANELGASMLGVPEELGGVMTERSAVTSVLVAEKLAHADMGLAAAILAPGAVSTAISLWGDAEQQSKYLPPFTEDDAPAAALAIQEPRVLFDPLELQTVATRSPDGFTLSGAKSLVLRAADAELFVVAARIEGEGPALFIIESGTQGLSVEADPAMGVRAAATGTLRLDDVAVGPDALLGGADPAVYSECVQRSRIAWAALAIGTGRAVLDYVIPYVNERQAFGEPISNRQAVAFTVSDIAIELEGMKLTTLRAASRADLGKSFAKEATIARQLVTDRGMQIGSSGVQLLGGHGYVKEYPVERWYRDLRSAGVMEGALLV